MSTVKKFYSADTDSKDLELIIGSEKVKCSFDKVEYYNQPGPRYTSYPTVVEWKEFSQQDYADAITRSNHSQSPISLYFHIPFCESLCLYCGCNTVITKDHIASSPYLIAVEREI